MCRSIVKLRDGAQPAPREEIQAAARQYIRKISGFRHPAAHNAAVFEEAVAAVADVSERLLAGLEVRGAG